jgi:hypothetical protein
VRRLVVVLVAVCVTAMLMGGTAYAKTVSVQTWVKGVCSTLVDWRDDLDQKSQDFQTSIADSKSIPVIKTAFVQFLDSAVSSTKSMISDVKALGTPQVKDGEGIAGVITNGLTTVQTGFKQALSSAQDLPTGKAEFQTAVTKLSKKLDASSARAGKIFDSADKKYDTKAVDAARKKNPDCDGLT